MAYLFGHIGLSATDRGFLNAAGQTVVYDAAQEYVNRFNMEMQTAMSVFVEGTTSDFKQRYRLPGGGYLQQRNENGRFDSVKPSGYWDVAFPLREWGAAVSWNNVSLAYASGEEISNAINTVINQDTNTVRDRILRALFNNTEKTFSDPLHGDLLVQPLANNDGVVYPANIGTSTEATENHYLGSAYAAASISDTNDPYVTIANELEEHFGIPTGGSNIVVFINSAQTALTRDLAAFVSLADMGVDYGDNQSLASSVPPQLLAMTSARVLGRHEEAGVWIVQWNYIPASYMLGIHLDAPAPLRMRIDPAYTGLGMGLQLRATDELFPFTTSSWSHRFGFGVANRLNGVVIDLSNTDSDYDIPSEYA
jgi:hypothetical protein